MATMPTTLVVRHVAADGSAVATSDRALTHPNGAYIVPGGEGDEVEVADVSRFGQHVDRPMGGEVGGVDEDAATGGVRSSGDARGHGSNDAGDVRRARHHEHGIACQPAAEVVEVECPVRTFVAVTEPARTLTACAVLGGEGDGVAIRVGADEPCDRRLAHPRAPRWSAVT